MWLNALKKKKLSKEYALLIPLTFLLNFSHFYSFPPATHVELLHGVLCAASPPPKTPLSFILPVGMSAPGAGDPQVGMRTRFPPPWGTHGLVRENGRETHDPKSGLRLPLVPLLKRRGRPEGQRPVGGARLGTEGRVRGRGEGPRPRGGSAAAW